MKCSLRVLRTESWIVGFAGVRTKIRLNFSTDTVTTRSVTKDSFWWSVDLQHVLNSHQQSSSFICSETTEIHPAPL